MDIQTQKEIIIEQFKQVEDVDLINAIKSMLDYSQKKETNIHTIPEEHQKLVMQRFDLVRNNPDRLLNWDEVKKTL